MKIKNLSNALCASVLLTMRIFAACANYSGAERRPEGRLRLAGHRGETALRPSLLNFWLRLRRAKALWPISSQVLTPAVLTGM